MEKCDFNVQWRKWIMDCMSSVSYRDMVNGSPRNSSFPSKGLKQGDPISPFLFLLCTKGLSTMMAAKQRQGLILGIKIKSSSLAISYLLFVDDYYVFSEVCMAEINSIIETLSDFGLASGQIINHDKSELFFSPIPLVKLEDLFKMLFTSSKIRIWDYLQTLGETKLVCLPL